MEVRKILTGIDLSPSSEAIIAYAAHVASVTRASLDLLYVVDYLVTPPAYLEPYLEEEKKNAAEKLNIYVERLSQKEITAKAEVTVGRLQEAFDNKIKHTKADLLVLGFASHILRRSSSEKIIKSLQVPMLVIRGEKSQRAQIGAVNIRKILCPVDFSERSKEAFMIAVDIMKIFSASLEVLSIVPSFESKKQYKNKEIKKNMKLIVEETTTKLKEFSTVQDIERTVLHGNPYETISYHAKQKDIDLTIMGARGLGLIKGMLVGSVTDAVLKSSPCPVMVIH
jgi:nucleotide-binding universal stress UspA family protein